MYPTAEGDVPTAAKVNLSPGGNLHMGWDSDYEPLFGECGRRS